MSVFSKIKNWLTGTSNKNSSYKTSKKSLSSSKNNTVSIQKQLVKQKAEQEEKKKKLQQAFKAKELNVQSKAKESNYKQNGGADKVLKKIQQKATDNNAYKTSAKTLGNQTAQLPKAKVPENGFTKSQKKATGLTTKELQFQNKLGLNNQLKAGDITYSAQNNGDRAAFNRGLTSGATLGLSELLANNAAPEIKQALENQEQNYTKEQKVANTVGEVVGTFMPYGMSMGGASKLGKALAGNTADDAARVVANSKWMQNLATRTGKDALELSSKIADSLVTDLGLHLTTENLQSIIMGLNTYQDTGSADDAVTEYIKQQAINSAFNLGMDLAPLAGRAAQAVAKYGSAKLADNSGKVVWGEGLGKVSDETGVVIPKLKEGKQVVSAKVENLKRLARDNAEADVSKTLGMPKGKAKVNASANQSVRLAEKRWNDAIETYAKNGDTSKLPKWVREAIDENEMSRTDHVSALKQIRDEYLQATREATGKKDLPFGAQPRREAFERANNRLFDSLSPQNETKAMVDEAIQQNEKNVLKQEPPATKTEIEQMLDNEAKQQLPQPEEQNPLGAGTERTANAFGDENIKTATTEQMNIKEDTYLQNYGYGAKGVQDTATSHSSKSLTGMTTSDVEREILNDMETEGLIDYKIVHHGEVEDVIAEVATNPKKYTETLAKIANGDAVETSFKGFSEKSLRKTHAGGLVTMKYYGQCIKEAQAAGVPIPKEVYENYANAVIAVKDIASQSGGVLEMQRYFAMLSPTTRRKIAERDVERLLEKSRGFRFKSEYKGKLNNGKGAMALKERKAQIQEIIRSNKDLQEKLAKLEGTATKDAEEIKALTSQLETLKKQVADGEAEVKRLNDAIKVADNADEVSKLKAQLDEANTRLKEANADYKAVEDEIPTQNVNYLTEEEVADVYTEVINEVNKMIPMTALDYVQEWRYLAMLGNPKTHIRNRIGNFVFKGVRTTSNAVGTMFEKGMKAKYIEQADKFLKEAESGKLSAEALDFVENAYGVHKIDSVDDLTRIREMFPEKDLSGIKVGDYVSNNGSYRRPEYVTDKLKAYKRDLEFTRKSGFSLEARREAHGEAKTIEGKLGQDAWKEIKDTISTESKMGVRTNKGRQRRLAVVGKMSDFNSQLLENADKSALEANFRESFYKMAKENGLTNLKEGSSEYKSLYNRIVEESKNDALEATFREYNQAAEFLNNITKKMYDANATRGERALAVGVNAVVPFAKTPANILRQSVRYSPAGLIQGATALREAAKKGDAALLNQAVDRFASGLTGTGILALGTIISLLNPDMITTNAGNSDIAKLKKRDGTQDYSVTIGDHSFTLDWLTPVSTTFFVGAEFANLIREAGTDEFNLFESAENVGILITRVIEPMLETSMLSGLNDMFNGINNTGWGTDKVKPIAKMGGSIAQNYVSSLVPTLVGQIARTAYSSDKQLTGETDLEYFTNSLKNKAGLANTNLITEAQGAKTDSWGNVVGEKKDIKDYAKSAIINIASPANVKKLTAKESDKKIIAEYNKLIEGGIEADTAKAILPKPNYNKAFDVGRSKDTKEAVEMTNKELATYNKARATGGEDAMASALESIMFNRPTTDSNGKKILADDAYSKEDKAEIINKFKGKSAEDVVNWVMSQPQFKKSSVYEQKLLLATIFDNSGEKAKGNRRTSERAVWKAQGKNVNEYDFKNELSAKKQANLQSAIDSGIVTYKEAVDFGRNAGKTYYYEDEDGGGSSQTYYNKSEMIAYLQKKGYSYEKAEALYNAFKNSNSKAYNGSGSSSGGGWGYRRGGGSSGKKISNAKASAYNVKTFTPKSKTSSTKSKKAVNALDTALENMNSNAKKITPPKNK